MGMRHQPQGLARIGQSALTKGLRLALNGAGSMVRPVVGPDVNPVGSPSVVVGEFGKAIQFNGTSQALAVPIDLSNTQAVTVIALVDLKALTGTQQMLWEYGTDTVGTRRGFDAYFSQTQMEVWLGSNGTGRYGNIYAPPTVGPHVIATVHDSTLAVGSQISMYMDGALQARKSTSSASAGRNGFFPNDTLYISARTASTSWATNSIALFLLFDRALSGDEIELISRNAWQLFSEAEEDDNLAAKAVSYLLSVGRAALGINGGQVSLRAARKLRAAPAPLALSAGQVVMRTARRLRAQAVALAIAGKSVVLRAGRRVAIAPSAMSVTARSVGMQYNQVIPPGAYTLPVSAAAMQLGRGSVGMRVSRRLAVAPAQLQAAAGAVRALVGRRLLVDGARLVAQGRSVTLRYSAAAPPFDITKIHPSRVVIFEGSGSRVTPFEGSGSRVTPFDGSGSRVTPFEGSGSRVTRFE